MFKHCSLCNKEWISRDSFLCDSEIVVIGYQADFEKLGEGLYLFNHNKPGCRTTLACYVHDFMDLYSGEFFQESKYQSGDCPGHCQDSGNIESCRVKCKNSYPRELIQIIKNYKK